MIIEKRKRLDEGRLNGLRLALLAALILTPVAIAQAQTAGGDAKALFGSRCYSCHSIGGGDKQGPDLKGVTTRRTKEWIQEFVKSPGAMNAKGDATARELFGRFPATTMPDQALTPEQLDSILALVEELTAKNQTFVPEGAKLARAIQPGDVDAGLRLFTGRVGLRSGGTACISCHSIDGAGALGGGTLGPDLTVANVKYTDPELIGILQNPNFPTMASVFANRKLTEEEIVQLFALFQYSKTKSPGALNQATTTRIDPTFLMIGVFMLVLTLACLNIIWRNRARGVREALVERSTES